MTAAEYTSTTANAAFVVLINLTTDPIHSIIETTEKIADTICLHRDNHRYFQLYHDVDKALCNKLTASTPITFLQELQDQILGLRQVTFLQMLTHLRETYCKITQSELNQNENTSVAFTIINILQGCVGKIDVFKRIYTVGTTN